MIITNLLTQPIYNTVTV